MTERPGKAIADAIARERPLWGPPPKDSDDWSDEYLGDKSPAVIALKEIRRLIKRSDAYGADGWPCNTEDDIQ